jgi:hypothetical protein
VNDSTGAQALRRLETWLWTGPVGHFVGGALDLLQALLAYRRKRRASGSQRIR